LSPLDGLAQEPPRRFNLVVLVADDLRADTLGFAGHPIVQTPHLDALAKKGVRFRNHFVTTAICAVSRASIFSGQYARRHGINDFKTSFTPDAWAQTYPALLRAAGYQTGFIGKFGVGDAMPVAAFDFWRGFPGQGAYFTKQETTHHLTARMWDQALAFLQNLDRSRPFCLSLSFKAPHAQDGAAREFPPDARDAALYADVDPAPARTAAARFFAMLPLFVQKSEARTRWLRRFATPEMARETTRDYFRLITGLDREVGRIIAALTDASLLAETVIVFTSDNGFFLGERGLADKWFMYEEAIRVPFLILDPKAGGRAGATIEAMTLNLDIAPTLLDYASIPAPRGMQGKSVRPWVGDETPAWRHEFFYEHLTLPKIIPQSEGVRSERMSYLRWLAEPEAIEELYDDGADPLQQRNLVSDPAQQSALEQLRKRWAQLREEAR
jgi:arylsulfatase A-like enzyme